MNRPMCLRSKGSHFQSLFVMGKARTPWDSENDKCNRSQLFSTNESLHNIQKTLPLIREDWHLGLPSPPPPYSRLKIFKLHQLDVH